MKSASRSASVSKLMTMVRSPLRITRDRKRAAASCSAPSVYCSLPLVSISRPSVIGSFESLEKKAIFCSLPSSLTLKSFCSRVGDDLLGFFVAHRGEEVDQVDLHADAAPLRRLAGRLLLRRRG